MSEQEDERYGANGDDLESAERAAKRHRSSKDDEKEEELKS